MLPTQSLLVVRADGDAEEVAKALVSSRLPGTTLYATPSSLMAPPTAQVQGVTVFRDNATFKLDIPFFSAILRWALPGAAITVYANDSSMEKNARWAGIANLSASNGALTGRAPGEDTTQPTSMNIDEEDIPLAPISQVGQGKESCATKKRACANCSCGRKDLEGKVGIEEAKKMLENGTQRSACGSCYLGDAFRCASCPYKGQPAFKAGNKVELDESSAGLAPELNPDAPMTTVTAGGALKLSV